MISTMLALVLCMFIFQQEPVQDAKPKTSSTTWVINAANDYTIHPNITYLTAENYESKLDIYRPADPKTPLRTVIYFHGGGWVGGTRNTNIFEILPYLEMGWAVVNVDYRLASVSLAPAAVEDCRCALKWVISHAKQYMFDVNRIVVSGRSAGGHLALTTGLLPTSAGLDVRCYYDEDPMELKVAAIINWYGITDVTDVLDGPNMKTWARHWLGPGLDREETARRLSPLNYLSKNAPAILTIHGDADPVVPYAHAVRLHQSLDELGVENKLLTVRGGGHGRFNTEVTTEIYEAIRLFLERQAP